MRKFRARFGVEAAQRDQHVFQRGFVNAAFLLQCFKIVFFHERKIRQHHRHHRRQQSLVAQLELHALRQVDGENSRRFVLLHPRQHHFDIRQFGVEFPCHFHQIAAEISRFIQTFHQG